MYLDEQPNVPYAIDMIQCGESNGELSGVGVFDTETKRGYVSTICVDEESDPEQLINDAKEEGYDISDYAFENFDAFGS